MITLRAMAIAGWSKEPFPLARWPLSSVVIPTEPRRLIRRSAWQKILIVKICASPTRSLSRALLPRAIRPRRRARLASRSLTRASIFSRRRSKGTHEREHGVWARGPFSGDAGAGRGVRGGLHHGARSDGGGDGPSAHHERFASPLRANRPGGMDCQRLSAGLCDRDAADGARLGYVRAAAHFSALPHHLWAGVAGLRAGESDLPRSLRFLAFVPAQVCQYARPVRALAEAAGAESLCRR